MTKEVSRKFVEAEEWPHETAAAPAGLDDFGDDYYLGGLRVLLEVLDNDLKLDQNGRYRVTGLILGVVVSQLYSQKGRRKNPECLKSSIGSRSLSRDYPAQQPQCCSGCCHRTRVRRALRIGRPALRWCVRRASGGHAIRFSKAHAGGKPGFHRYTLKDFGLDRGYDSAGLS
jgi:hypothetical protein